MTKSADSYIADEKHLPVFMRDFHDQKDLFKAISMTRPEYPVSWVDGHCYVIDRFLPFMAEHGYTLQRSRAKIRFAEIRTTIANCSEQLRNRFARVLNASKEDGTRTRRPLFCVPLCCGTPSNYAGLSPERAQSIHTEEHLQVKMLAPNYPFYFGAALFAVAQQFVVRLRLEKTMNTEKRQTETYVITGFGDLDAVTVYVTNYKPGQGKLVIECYGEAWAHFWGGMGERTLQEFVLDAHNDYLLGKLLPGDTMQTDFDEINEQAHKRGFPEICVTSDVEVAMEASEMSRCFGPDWYMDLPRCHTEKYRYLGRILNAVKAAFNDELRKAA